MKLYEAALFPIEGAELDTVLTDPDGGYRFDGLDAPIDYVVAVYASSDASDPLDSQVRRTEPGVDSILDDFVIIP
jgi:hypothetical protein